MRSLLATSHNREYTAELQPDHVESHPGYVAGHASTQPTKHVLLVLRKGSQAHGQ
jgi:hypothetical protein